MNLRCASLTRNVTSYPYEFVGDFFFKHDARQIDAVAGLAFGVGLTSSVSVVIGRCLSLQWFGGRLDVILFYFCSVTARKSMAQRDVHGATCILSNKYDNKDYYPLINMIIQLLNKTSRICSFLHCLTHCSAISIALCTVWSHWCPFPFSACFLHVETWRTVFMSCFRLHAGVCRTSVLIALMSWEGRRWNSNGC